MTKWARMRRRKERRRQEKIPKNSETEEMKVALTEPEEKFDKTIQSEEIQKFETSKTSKSFTTVTQLTKYVYLIAVFALLSGVFFPFITFGTEGSISFVIGGTLILFLGLAGSILIFKATTPNNNQRVFLVIGFVLIAVSIALIFQIQEWWKIEYVRDV